MNIGILGAGSWGTALAMAAHRAGHRTLLWGRDAASLRDIDEERENRRYLPGIGIDRQIRIEPRQSRLCTMDMLLAAVPAQAMRDALAPLEGFGGTLLICAKGIERGTGARLGEVAREMLANASIGVLSGPSFAGEVALGKPTALTLGMSDAGDARAAAHALSSGALRIYPSDDPVGIEIGGAMKNVIAIAAGAVMGRDLGENARAAVITRGLAEISRLAIRLGGRPETLSGLSGLGDLMLTATSLTSRNTAFGHALGRGADPTTLREGGGKLSEGAWTASAALSLARRHGIELPITQAVADVLEGRADLDEAIAFLINRPLRERE